MITTAPPPTFAVGDQVRVKIPIRCRGVDLYGRVGDVLRVVDMSLPGTGARLLGLEVDVFTVSVHPVLLFVHEVESAVSVP